MFGEGCWRREGLMSTDESQKHKYGIVNCCRCKVYFINHIKLSEYMAQNFHQCKILLE